MPMYKLLDGFLKMNHNHPTIFRDCHGPFLPNLAMTTLKNVIANLGNKGVKQSQILKLIFQNNKQALSEKCEKMLPFTIYGMLLICLIPVTGTGYHWQAGALVLSMAGFLRPQY